MKKEQLKYIGCGAFVLAAVAIILARPFAGLQTPGHNMLGIMLVSLGIWIFKPFNLSYAMGGLFLALAALVQGLPAEVVFTGFTQSALWTLLPALFFGYALQKTGLGHRIALGIMKLCHASYASIVVAWAVIGVVLSMLTPATTMRVAIVIPIAAQCCELLKLQKKSRGNSLIMLTAFAMAMIPGSGWLTGVIWGPFIQGLYDAVPALAGTITFNSWASVLFLPTMLVTALLVLGSLLFMRPKEKISAEAMRELKAQQFDKPSRDEMITMVILLVSFVMFVTGQWHGISMMVLCLAAMLLFFVTGVLKPVDFNAGVNWDIVVFIATSQSLGAIFNATGVSVWLGEIAVPALAPIAGSPWLFMFGVVIFLFIWRFVDVAMFVPTVAILVPVLPAVQAAYGISPLVWLPIFMFAGNAFFLCYQNVWAMISRTLAGDRAWQPKHLTSYGTIYFVACMVAMVFGVLWWNHLQLF